MSKGKRKAATTEHDAMDDAELKKHKTEEDSDDEDVDLATLDFEDALQVGLAFQQFQSYESAIAAFETAVRHQPAHYGALSRLADCYAEIEDFEKALPVYSRASACPEADAALWLSLGMTQSAVEKNEDAMKSYDRARALAVDEIKKGGSVNDVADCQRTYGMALAAMANSLGMEQDDLAGAVALYRDAVTTFPDSANLHYNIASMQLANEDKSGAIASLKRAIECDGDVVDFYEELVTLLSDEKEIAEYTKQLEEVRKRHVDTHVDDEETKEGDDEEEDDDDEDEDEEEDE
ncbi:hypothetical protein Poli38472_012525 [Pythium oligandrum]|uniref:Uncharacterized protein n=1 Tax=Pythium oligandrum TaxID=41045 RepID=A0A8K1FHT0_PYTOL|nr:hypothetical protein Poli38472_012525 [Pythium oligandrum]|eukprot:TMW61334.1 hypothetical protein Poli38472_012525 [Pythium oligandrum]